MNFRYCLRCTPDMNGQRRPLLAEGGTKCHGCGWTMPKVGYLASAFVPILRRRVVGTVTEVTDTRATIFTPCGEYTAILGEVMPEALRAPQGEPLTDWRGTVCAKHHHTSCGCLPPWVVASQEK